MINTCTKCKIEKEKSDFYTEKRVASGIATQCKDCHNIQVINMTRSKLGKLKKLYDKQVQSSKKRGHNKPLYTKKEFVDMFINDSDYLRHYDNWVNNNYIRYFSPSFDRKDDDKPYTFDNIQIMYWFENDLKGHQTYKRNRHKQTDFKTV
tara:strand:- start:13 stop:462 length:450 start_codon:yes stop_codon:yes gene_type:complete